MLSVSPYTEASASLLRGSAAPKAASGDLLRAVAASQTNSGELLRASEIGDHSRT